MICFNTDEYKLYNHLIHHFFEVEKLNDDKNVEKLIDLIVPKYLRREQFEKCKQTFKELYLWTGNNIEYDIEAFHEFLLYKFIQYLCDKQEKLKDFVEIYFDEECHLLIKKYSPVKYRKYYYEVREYIDYIFDDLDFLSISDLYNERSLGKNNLEDHFGININYYFSLLPIDVQKKYENTNLTLSGDVSEVIEYISNKIKHGSLSKLFWSDNIPVNNKQIQIIIDNIMTSFYHNKDIEILWQSNICDDILNFEIYKRREESNKILFQLRRANRTFLKKGYEKELLDYTDSYKNAYYVIICFTDEEYNRTIDFIKKYVYTDTVRLYVNLIVFDVRKKVSASKM